MKKDHIKPASAATPLPAVPSELDAMEKILTLAPLAVRVIGRILDNMDSPLNAQNQVIDIILNRAYGKPEGILKMKSGERTIEESGVHIQAIIEKIRKKGEMNNE